MFGVEYFRRFPWAHTARKRARKQSRQKKSVCLPIHAIPAKKEQAAARQQFQRIKGNYFEYFVFFRFWSAEIVFAWRTALNTGWMLDLNLSQGKQTGPNGEQKKPAPNNNTRNKGSFEAIFVGIRTNSMAIVGRGEKSQPVDTSCTRKNVLCLWRKGNRTQRQQIACARHLSRHRHNLFADSRTVEDTHLYTNCGWRSKIVIDFNAD